MPLFGTIVDLDSAAKAAGTAVSDNRYIAGSFKTYLTLADFQATASNAVDRFQEGQIVYISSSNELYKISVEYDPSLFTNVVTSQSFSWPGSGGSTDTGSLLTTGSVSGNVLTFTKGDGTTFDLTVDTGSGGGGSAFPFTGSAEITGSLGLTGSLGVNIEDGNGGNTKFAINNEGVAVLAALTTAPTAVTGGIYYSSSGDFFFGIS